MTSVPSSFTIAAGIELGFDPPAIPARPLLNPLRVLGVLVVVSCSSCMSHGTFRLS